jgi:hypothetical protein
MARLVDLGDVSLGQNNPGLDCQVEGAKDWQYAPFVGGQRAHCHVGFDYFLECGRRPSGKSADQLGNIDQRMRQARASPIHQTHPVAVRKDMSRPEIAMNPDQRR